MSDIESRLRALEARVNGMIRVGVVTAQEPEKGAARVEFKDRSELVSYELPIMVKQTLKNKDSYMPDIGEHVTCVFLPNGLEQGFILGAFYSKVDTPINTDPNRRRTDFEDGAYHYYDRSEHVHKTHYQDGSEITYEAQSNKLTISIAEAGIVELNCKDATVNTETATVAASDSITLDTPETTCTGNLIVEGSVQYGNGLTGSGGANITGNVSVTGNITATGSITDSDGDGGA